MPSSRAVLVIKAGLGVMQRFIEVSDIPTQQVLTFLTVAAQASETVMADLAEATGVAQSSVSRNCSVLGEGMYVQGSFKKGYGLIESFDDPRFRRRKLVKLTARGEDLVKELDRATVRLLTPKE
jgi:hypothetical protein